ncbi:MAG TPA: cupredoxin domain-containing protein [Thermoanaerobaculia bacterium]|nr:cupredoxin domain-containing protein [Thermoanaerobaculia bacterium]
MSGRYWSFVATLGAAVVLLVTTTTVAQDQGQVREFTISGNRYAFSPSSLTVNRNDLVTITFTAHDLPHSFTIDDYRIAKRAGTGQAVTFEFRADRPGTFTFYCNLSLDEKCKDMKGTLTVK